MEKETVNATEIKETEAPEKMFTQGELDTIISDRLKRERDKYADYDELKEKAAKLDQIEEDAKSELQKATERAEKLEAELSARVHADEVRAIRDKVAQETGVPAALLTAETEDACAEQAKAINAYKASTQYPTVKDSGEIQGTIKGSTKQQFAEWAEQVFN